MPEEIKSAETDYRNKFAISQTSLKDWRDMSPLTWYKTYVTKEFKRKVSTAVDLGSFLDCIIFTPEETEKRFIVATIKLPSKKVKQILDDLWDHYFELNTNAKIFNNENPDQKKIPYKKPTLEDKTLISALCEEHDHYKGKPDQGYNDVLKKGTPYFDFLKTTKGRKIISSEDQITALELKKILYEDKISKGFFTPKTGCEVVFQQRIFTEFSIGGLESVQFLPFKGAIDIIHFNHKLKQVREVDLKCTENAYQFNSPIGPVKKFDYPTQHSVYDFLLREWLKIYKDGKYEDYAIMNPLNVVIDQYEKIPYIYSYTMDDLAIKRYGIDNTPIRGWEDTIHEIAWHFDSGNWNRPKEHQQNGFISIKVFNKGR